MMRFSVKLFCLLICLFNAISCTTDGIKPKKLNGKWSLSSQYWYTESGGVKKLEQTERHKPADEYMSLHFTSKDEVLFRLGYYGGGQVRTCKYTYTESTKKLTLIQSDGYSWFFEIVSLDSKELKLKQSEYSDYYKANEVREYTFVKL